MEHIPGGCTTQIQVYKGFNKPFKGHIHILWDEQLVNFGMNVDGFVKFSTRKQIAKWILVVT